MSAARGPFTIGEIVTAWRGGQSEPETGRLVQIIPASSAYGRRLPAMHVVQTSMGEMKFPARYTVKGHGFKRS